MTIIRFIGTSEPVAFEFADGEQEQFEGAWRDYLKTGEARLEIYRIKRDGKERSISLRFDAITFIEFDRPKTDWTFS